MHAILEFHGLNIRGTLSVLIFTIYTPSLLIYLTMVSHPQYFVFFNFLWNKFHLKCNNLYIYKQSQRLAMSPSENIQTMIF